jgi:hypothetical protein
MESPPGQGYTVDGARDPLMDASCEVCLGHVAPGSSVCSSPQLCSPACAREFWRQMEWTLALVRVQMACENPAYRHSLPRC